MILRYNKCFYFIFNQQSSWSIMLGQHGLGHCSFHSVKLLFQNKNNCCITLDIMIRQKKKWIIFYIFSTGAPYKWTASIKKIDINLKINIKNEEKKVARKTLQFPGNLLPSKEVFHDLIEYYVIFKNTLYRAGLENWMNYTNSSLGSSSFT